MKGEKEWENGITGGNDRTDETEERNKWKKDKKMKRLKEGRKRGKCGVSFALIRTDANQKAA